MPPCFDVYVWVSPKDRAALLAGFLHRFVDRADSGEPRLDSFIRSFVTMEPRQEDEEVLAELRFTDHPGPAITIYLRAIGFYGAIVTLTDEGDVVLGLSLDDPMNDPDVERRASEVLNELMEDFGGSAGIGGVELPPPRSRAEWFEDGLVVLRRGTL